MDENDSSSLTLVWLTDRQLLHLALNFGAGKVWRVRPDVQRSGDIHVVEESSKMLRILQYLDTFAHLSAIPSSALALELPGRNTTTSGMPLAT